MPSTERVEISGEAPRLSLLAALFASTSPLQPLVVAGHRDLMDLIAAQASAQQREWAAAFGETGHRTVLVGGAEAGRLWTADVADDEVRLVDITLLPEWRGQGLGGLLLSRVVADAEARRRDVVLHVAPDNPARRLYARHGFCVERETETHLRLRRSHRRG